MDTHSTKSISSILAIAFFAITVTALLIAGSVQIYIHGETSAKTVSANQTLIAIGAAKSVANFIEQKFSIMETALSMGHWSMENRKECRSFLESMLGRDKSFRNLIYLDPTGEINAAVSRQSHVLSGKFIQQIDQDMVSRFKQTRRYISPVSIDPQTYEPLVTLSVWSTNIFGDFRGLLAVEVNLKFIWTLVDKLKIGETGQSYVVDKNGTLLAAKDISRVIRGENIAHISKVREFIRQASSNQSIEASIFKGMHGTNVVGTAVGLGTPDWAVVTELPVKEAYRDVKNSIFISVGSLLVIALASAWIGFLMARRLANPLVDLSDIASRITEGEMNLHAPVKGPREVCALADAFNQMTSQLINMLAMEEARAHKLALEIEERKKTQAALNESESVLRATLESTEDGVLVVGKNGKVTHYNSRFSEIWSIPEGILATRDDNKMIQSVLSQLVDPEQFIAEVEKLYQSAKTSRDILTFKNGRIIDRFSAPLIRSGRDNGRVWFFRDITERKKNEEEVRQLRNYLSNIINSMPSALVGVDANGRVTQWNKTVAASTGITADAAQGKPLSELMPWMTSEMANISKSIRTRQTILDSKKQRLLENGACYEDVTIYPLVSNGVEGAVIRIDDVTERVRMEEMMVQSEKMLSVGGLAAGMAHEINNPLAGMIQTARVMANRLDRNNTIAANLKAAEEAGTTMEAIGHFMEKRGILRMAETIIESGQRVADIVSNMLSFARKSEARISSYSLADLIDKTLELATTDYDLKKHYDFKQVEVVKEYAENLPSVPCEGAKIQQVLLNILRNGAQAMQTSGTENPRFTIRGYVDDHARMACMEIEDNGPGMDEATRRRVFEPFFTTKPVGVGTGLGLSVSYFIITENHNGQMNVESSPGKGTIFTIHLPLEGAHE